MLDFVYLTGAFFADYGHFEHIMQKPGRPYVRVMLKIDGVTYCIPLRSNIHHPHVFWTDKENNCGIDYGNTVIITDVEKYIDSSSTVHLRQNEFDSLKGKEHLVRLGLEKYLRKYKAAKANMSIPRNKTLVEHSSLQYFEEYLDL